MNKARLEAFSDGVIAIIITIMVLEIKVPHENTWEALGKLGPVFLSYLLSFVFLGIYWVNHHHLIHSIRKVQASILWTNLILLFWLSLIPFVTAWMGESNFEKNPVILYAVLANCCGLSYFFLLLAIKKTHQDHDDMTQLLTHQSNKGMISLIIYLTALFVAFFFPLLSFFIMAFVSVIWFIPDRNIERSLLNKEK